MAKTQLEQLVIEASRVAVKGEHATMDDRNELLRLWYVVRDGFHPKPDTYAFICAVKSYLDEPGNRLKLELLDVATRVMRHKFAKRDAPASKQAQPEYWWQRGAMA